MKIEKYISPEQISEALDKIAGEINDCYGDEDVIFCVIMKGSMIFAADLIRRLKMPVRVEFMRAKSYDSGTVASGEVNILCDMDCDIAGKNLILVEDIIDTGNTLYTLTQTLEKRKPKSIKLCTLLDKPSRRIAPLSPDFCGITIPDEFVVGYGLDYNERFRELPYIGIVQL